MRALLVEEALARNVMRVTADARPEPAESGVFAVFDGDGEDAPFLGLVTPRDIARHPRRIFADLLSPTARERAITDDANLETTLERMEAAGTSALAVLNGEGRFVGAVTRESLSLYLLAQERSLLAEIGSREAQLRAILRALPDTLVRVDVDGTPLDLVRRDPAVSDDGTWEPVSGTRPVGRRLYENFPEEVRAALVNAVRESVTSGTTAVVPFCLKEGATSRDYEARVVRWGDRSALIVSNDTTELNALRAKVELADRMVAVGTLAAAVAHEINNPLTYVLLNLELLQQRYGAQSGGPDGVPFEGMREGLMRIRAAVTDLMRVARPSEPTRAAVDVREVLESSLRLATYEIKHRARLTRDFCDVPKVEANKGSLGQVFLNLLLNAAHSIGEGAAGQNEIRVTTRTDAAGRAVVEIRDSGCGMPESVRQRIFEPFFTTKPEGVGTGLGLSICSGIVSALGGLIEVESTFGRGSLFRVVLPPAAVAARPPSATVAAPVDLLKGAFLVVDDEPHVGRALARVVGPEQTVTCTSARDALALIQNGHRFDAIVCDLMMPEMTGAEFYEALTGVAPAQARRTLFVSGGAFTERARAFLASVRPPFIEKPVDTARLRALVAKVAAGP